MRKPKKTKKTKKTVKRYPRLVGKSREKASKYIAQERRAGRPIEQAVAIGISRVRAEQKKSRIMAVAAKYL